MVYVFWIFIIFCIVGGVVKAIVKPEQNTNTQSKKTTNKKKNRQQRDDNWDEFIDTMIMMDMLDDDDF